MARLTIRVGVKNVNGQRQTVSKFKTTRFEKVVVHNDGGAALTLTIDGATPTDSPLCLDGDPVTTITFPTATDPDTVKRFDVCGNKAKWTEFKYTAEVAGTVAEDPIVIIERWKFREIDASVAVVGAVIGLVAGYAVARATRSRKTPAR